MADCHVALLNGRVPRQFSHLTRKALQRRDMRFIRGVCVSRVGGNLSPPKGSRNEPRQMHCQRAMPKQNYVFPKQNRVSFKDVTEARLRPRKRRNFPENVSGIFPIKKGHQRPVRCSHDLRANYARGVACSCVRLGRRPQKKRLASAAFAIF